MSRTKQFKRNLRHGLVDKRQLKIIMPNKTFSQIYLVPYTLHLEYKFLLFKARAFPQIFFPRNLLFRQILRTSVFLNSKCLKTSNKRSPIFLSINQFVSLIELKM